MQASTARSPCSHDQTLGDAVGRRREITFHERKLIGAHAAADVEIEQTVEGGDRTPSTATAAPAASTPTARAPPPAASTALGSAARGTPMTCRIWLARSVPKLLLQQEAS
jgi:hypothetical protein